MATSTTPIKPSKDSPQNSINSKDSSQTSSESFELSRTKANQSKTKFVVRKIPLFVKKSEIEKYLKEFNNSYDWFNWCTPSNLPNPTRRNKTKYNRFYINFKSFQDAIPFIEKFKKLEIKQKPKKNDNKKKKDVIRALNQKFKGPTIYKLNVEFAPNQGIPNKESSTKDRRINTIDKDKDFQQFVQGLKDKEKHAKEIQKLAQESTIRQTVIDTYGRGKKLKPIQPIPQPTKPEIAPLAQHVAAKRNRRIYSKKLDRASLVKSERAKEKKIEKNRALRRKKRIAVARANKYGKYGSSSRQWIAKNNEEDDRPKGRTKDRYKSRDRRYYDLKSKREKYNSGKKHVSDKYDRYNDRYNDYDYNKDYYYDDSYKSSKNGYRGSGSGRRHKRGRGGGGGRSGGNDRYYDKDEAHFSGYSRRKGHQTWAKAK